MPVTVYTLDEKQEVEDINTFSKDFEVLQAGGGVVQNADRQVLLIYRKGKWDLPKGKREDNEPIELCAEREVKEETGLTDLMLRRKLLVTYHTYKERGKNILKETHWYVFDAPGKQNLTPQTDEDINEVKWLAKEDLATYKKNTYLLIIEVLEAAGY